MKNNKFVGTIFILIMILGLAVTGFGIPGQPDETEVTLSPDPVETEILSEFTVTAKLTVKSSGDAISGETIQFKLGKDTDGDGLLDTVLDSGTNTTGTSGEAQFSFSSDAIEQPGTYTYKGTYDASGNDDYNGDVTSATVNATKADTEIFAVTGPVTVDVGEDITVTAGLDDSGGDPVGGETLRFELIDTDGSSVLETIEKTTDSTSGEATATFSTHPADGDYSYKVTHPESGQYLSSTASWELFVEKITTVLEVRTGNPFEMERRSFRVAGDYSLHVIEPLYRTGPKRKSCVFIHTYTHSTPGVV